MMLSHQSGSCGKTDGFRKLGKFQDGYLQRGTAYRSWGRGAKERAHNSRTSTGGTVTTPRAGGRWRAGHQQIIRRVTKRRPDPESNDIWPSDTDCSNPGRRRGIHFLTSHQGTSLGLDAFPGGGPPQTELRFKPSSSDSKSCTLYTPCFVL